MPAIISARLLFLVGSSLSFSISRKCCSHRGVRCLSSKYDRQSGPLTLESLGFRSEREPIKDDKPKELREPLDSAKRKAKVVIPNQVEAASVKESLEVDATLFSAVEATKRKPKVARPNQVKAPALEVDTTLFSAKSFSELGLPPLLLDRLENVGFNAPTDVQSTAIPTIMNHHDVVIQSYTGSGKTLAYLLPILSEIGPLATKMPNRADQTKKKDIEAVIVAPSRELGMQIVREVEKLLGPTEKRAVQQIVGGANRSRQEEALKKNKPSIVVGTPGRIAEISATGKLHTHGCRFLVLDEVDELLAFNFREDMHRILEHVGRKSERQTIMVSATVPFSVVRAARSWGRDPVLVKAKEISPIESVSPSGPINSNPTSQTQAATESLPPSLKHFYCVAKLQHKVDTLRRCIYALDAKFVMVFMNNIKQLKDTVYKLDARGIKAEELHGDLNKLTRTTILKKFKGGELRVLVTNELAARGLDVPECDLVVNLDMPTDSIHYAHRAGRTGRLGRKGTVVNVCEQSEVFVVKKLERQLGVPVLACDFVEGELVVKEEGRVKDK